MKDTHTILNEIIVAAKECGQVMLQADRNNFGIKDKAGKANFVQHMTAKSRKCCKSGCRRFFRKQNFWERKRIAGLTEMRNIFLWWTN